jgi:alanine-glyoxylate transaminase/serine-glyoxylate transaminase/serine-pyruvate transaminase
MNAYEAGTPAYFATPPVNLIYAYRASLKLIVSGGDQFPPHLIATRHSNIRHLSR